MAMSRFRSSAQEFLLRWVFRSLTLTWPLSFDRDTPTRQERAYHCAIQPGNLVQLSSVSFNKLKGETSYLALVRRIDNQSKWP